MITVKNVTYETDKRGEHKVIEQSNGVKIKLLQKPSAAYLKQIEKEAKKSAKLADEKRKKRDEEKLIQEKMRELAIAQLKKEGKL